MQGLSVEKIKAGDENELRQLFEVLLPRIRLWASQDNAYHGADLSVDDVVQDVIYKIYSNLHKLTPDNVPDSEALMKWCRVLTSNVIFSTLRHQRSKREVNIDDVDERKLPAVEIDFERVLEEAILLLPKDEKDILLRWVEGKSPQEISRELGISLATTYRRLKIAQKILVSLVLPSARGPVKEVG